MLALGKLLELTLAGREPAEKTQLTVEGVRMRWLSEGALEVRPPEARDNGLDLLLSAGIHGNETAPIELLDRLLHDIAQIEREQRARCHVDAVRDRVARERLATVEVLVERDEVAGELGRHARR